MIFLNQHNANKPLHAHLQQGVEGVRDRLYFLIGLPSQFSRLPKTLLYIRPIDQIPPGLHVVGPFLFIRKKIGVFPDIERQERDDVPL